MVKNTPPNAGDVRDAGLILGLGRSPEEGNDNPLLCLENPMDRGAWWAMVRGFTESNTTEVTQHILTPNQPCITQPCVPCDRHPHVPLIFALF